MRSPESLRLVTIRSDAASRLLSVLFVAAQLCAGVAAGATCATCHEKEARTQPETPMAHAMLSPAADPVFLKHPRLTFAQGAYTWRVEPSGSDVTYTVTDGTDSLALPVHWIFGEDSQTYVLEYRGHLYESRLSYYPEVDRLDFTVGNQKAQIRSLTEAMGRELAGHEIPDCFECHSTGAIVDDRLQLAQMTLGVQCEHCHRGADRHLQDIVRGKLDSVPAKLGRMTTEDTSNFCGQCHRSWGEVVRGHLFSLTNVRFQPYRLTMSRCYDGSDPRIGCLACHDPHRNLVTDNAFYEAKCLACHARSEAAARAESRKSSKAPARPCPVKNSGCIGCHMPKTRQPGGPRTLTDHYIRVVRAGEAYPE
jgi:Zn finger protein HypA/HybF involved in hydrogenase expression